MLYVYLSGIWDWVQTKMKCVTQYEMLPVASDSTDQKLEEYL